jgi:ketosteroid isomerase-like protein
METIMTNDELLRHAYALFGDGDLDGYLALCTPDVRFVIPGRSPMKGEYDRETFKSGLIADVMRLTGGSFRETLLDVYTSDRGGVAHCSHEFVRDGKAHAYRTLHLYSFRDGRIASFREVPEDLYQFDEVWA